MISWRAVLLLGLLALICPLDLWAQPDEVERLKQQVSELQAAMQAQREHFDARLRELQERLDRGGATAIVDEMREEIESQVERLVADKSKFYARPQGRRGADIGNDVWVFDVLGGGLIFTGLFRSRFDVRGNNVDFNAGDGGLDDQGVRFDGRFRLGFGAVLLKSGSKAPEVTALTEFQTVGTFANNTYISFTGPGGIPLPQEFPSFKEPFEQVGLYQGYLDLQRLFAEEFYLKVGRQELVFGNEFIFGDNAFYDGTVHDGIVASYVSNTTTLSSFFMKEAQSDSELSPATPADDFDEDWMAGLHASFDVSSLAEGHNLLVEAYALFFNGRSNFTDSFVTPTSARAFDGAYTPAIFGQFWTFGARVFWYRIPLFDGVLAINAEAAYQTGEHRLDDALEGSANRQSIHGWAAEVLLNYWFDFSAERYDPILSLGYYYAGGGRKSDASPNGFPLENIGFQPLFINRHFDTGDRHASRPFHAGGGRYGNMDLIPLNNVHIFKASLSIAPTPRWEVGVAGLMAFVADDEGYGTGLFGYEADVFGTFRYSDNLVFLANFSLFFPKQSAEDISNHLFFSPTGDDGAGDDIAYAFYLQVQISF
jgi:hypothetical protein